MILIMIYFNETNLLLDLSIGRLHNYLLPSGGGGSGVLLHSSLMSQLSPLDRRNTQTGLNSQLAEHHHNICLSLSFQPER